MCVILYKPAGVKLPGDATIDGCFLVNPDGAGYMLPNDGRVLISKGYMSVNSLLDALRREAKTELPLVVHFRLATHGGITRENTHPFPVTAKIQFMTKLNVLCDLGFAHNGIVNGYSWRKKDRKHYPDSALFAAKVLPGIFKQHGVNGKSHQIIERIARRQHSKFALMTKNGVTISGKRWVEQDGCFFSNDYAMWAYNPAVVIPTCKFCQQELRRVHTKPAPSFGKYFCDVCDEFVGYGDVRWKTQKDTKYFRPSPSPWM